MICLILSGFQGDIRSIRCYFQRNFTTVHWQTPYKLSSTFNLDSLIFDFEFPKPKYPVISSYLHHFVLDTDTFYQVNYITYFIKNNPTGPKTLCIKQNLEH